MVWLKKVLTQCIMVLHCSSITQEVWDMADKLFTIAGTSVFNDVLTYRFANGKVRSRMSVLRRNSHTQIQLFQLPDAMTKDAAIQWLNEQGIFAVKPATGRAAIKPLTEEEKLEQERALAEAKAAAEAAEAAQLEEDAKWVNELAAG